MKTFVKTFLRTVQILVSVLMAWMGFAWGWPHEPKPKSQPQLQLQQQLPQQPEPDTPEYVPPSKRSSPGYGKDHEGRPRLLLVIEYECQGLGVLQQAGVIDDEEKNLQGSLQFKLVN